MALVAFVKFITILSLSRHRIFGGLKSGYLSTYTISVTGKPNGSHFSAANSPADATLHAAAVSSAPCCLRRTVPIHPFYLTTDGISQRCSALAAAYNVSPIWVHGALSCRSGVSKVANTIVSISDKMGKEYEPP